MDPDYLAIRRDKLVERREEANRNKKSKRLSAKVLAAAVMAAGIAGAWHEGSKSVGQPINPQTIKNIAQIENATSNAEIRQFEELRGTFDIKVDSNWRSDPMVFEDKANGKSNRVSIFDGKEVKISNAVLFTDMANPANGDFLGAPASDGHWYYTSIKNIVTDDKNDIYSKIKKLTLDTMPSMEVSE